MSRQGPPVDWFFDRFSVAHAAVGVLFELSAVPPALAIGSHVAFELVENDIKEHFRHVWPVVTPDAWQNHVGDVLSFAAGYYASRALKADEGGRVALAALVGLAGVIWTWNLSTKHRLDP